MSVWRAFVVRVVGFVLDEEGQAVVLGWVTSNGGARCVAAVRLDSGGCGRFLRRQWSEGDDLRSCSAGFRMSWPHTSFSTLWRQWSSVKFVIFYLVRFVQFDVQFGLLVDVMARSYVDTVPEAMIFDRVRLDVGCHAHTHRSERCDGKDLRCSSASSENFVWVMSDFLVWLFAVMLVD